MPHKKPTEWDEQELRCALKISRVRPLVYKRLTQKGVQTFPVGAVRVVSEATSPAALPLSVTLENGKEHTVLASFFAAMQDPAFGLDGKER